MLMWRACSLLTVVPQGGTLATCSWLVVIAGGSTAGGVVLACGLLCRTRFLVNHKGLYMPVADTSMCLEVNERPAKSVAVPCMWCQALRSVLRARALGGGMV